MISLVWHTLLLSSVLCDAQRPQIVCFSRTRQQLLIYPESGENGADPCMFELQSDLTASSVSSPFSSSACGGAKSCRAGEGKNKP